MFLYIFLFKLFKLFFFVYMMDQISAFPSISGKAHNLSQPQCLDEQSSSTSSFKMEACRDPARTECAHTGPDWELPQQLYEMLQLCFLYLGEPGNDSLLLEHCDRRSEVFSGARKCRLLTTGARIERLLRVWSVSINNQTKPIKSE